MANKTVHVISHSHWDREWYMPFERHRVRLVALMDALLDTLERDPEYHSFHLDGQTIMLDDYLEVRPEKRDKLKQYIQEGRIQIGPWYILQDEFLTSGEANIRNLLVGHRDAKEFGPICKIGYFPDSFGNMGQAPQLLRQAGMDTAIFGRGVKPVGFNNDSTLSGEYESPYSEMIWESPDGSSVLGVLFANWYHNGMEIPTDPEEARAYWEGRIPNVERFASTPHLLFMNGCDHQPVQTDLSEALQQARRLFPGVQFRHSDFPTYIESVKASLPDNLATVRGELRSQRTDGWFTLVNTASARVYIKQANQRSQSLLEKAAEPMAAFAAMLGVRDYPHHLFHHAWKMLMQNHPHDSICGCSVDEVHSEMMTRFAKSSQVADEIVSESARAVASEIDTAGAFAPLDSEALPFAVWNTSGWERTGVLSVDVQLARLPVAWGVQGPVEQLKQIDVSEYAVVDSYGSPVPAAIEDLGVSFGYDLPEDRFREPYMARKVRVTLQARDVPSLGYAAYALVKKGGLAESHVAGAAGVADVSASGSEAPVMENEYLHITIADDGTLTVQDKRNGRTYSGWGAFENTGDVGNEYIYKQPENDVTLTTVGQPATVTLKERTTFRTVYEIAREWTIPASGDDRLEQERNEFVPFLQRKAGRSEQTVTLPITTVVTLESGVPTIRMQTRVDNRAKDHRLRVLFPTDINTPVHRVDSVLEVAVRNTIPAAEWVNPSNCQHQQAFVNVSDDEGGLTAANHGLNEYEVLRDGRSTIAITLLRAVGELGDWGVFPTPEAQCLGEHVFDYTLIPHAGGEGLAASYAMAYQEQTPWTAIQVPLRQGRLKPAGQLVRWSGEGMALTAVKISEETGDLILRWFNTMERPTQLTVEGSGVRISDWYKSNVLEEAGAAIPAGEAVPVRTAEILTIGGKWSK